MSKTIIYAEEAPAPIGPYSQAIRVGNAIYISGQIPIDTKTGQVTNDITDATDLVMRHIGSILSKAKMGYNNVVKCSIFVTNMNDFPKVNAAYQKYFQEDPPARETVEVASLPKGVNVEISCIAVE